LPASSSSRNAECPIQVSFGINVIPSGATG
jgi:hypothetical protein